MNKRFRKEIRSLYIQQNTRSLLENDYLVYQDESNINTLINLKSLFTFMFSIKYGSINSAEHSIITTLGIISASLLKFGVATKVMAAEE
jgi:hypothetical protein